MKVDVPGRGAVDISRVAIVGPVWTSLEMYSETCGLLQGTADAAAEDAGGISFRGLMWRGRTNAGMLRQMVRDLADECDDGSPRYDGVCMLPGWQSDGAAAFAAAVAGTLGAVVMGLEEWLRALEPASGGKQKGGE